MAELVAKFHRGAKGSDRIGKVVLKPRENIASDVHSGRGCPEGIILIRSQNRKKKLTGKRCTQTVTEAQSIYSWCSLPGDMALAEER